MPRNRRSTDPVDLAFSATLRAARAITGLSQMDIGVMAGLDGSYVGWIEQGHGCTLRSAVRLARVLGISLDQIMDDADNGTWKEAQS